MTRRNTVGPLALSALAVVAGLCAWLFTPSAPTVRDHHPAETAISPSASPEDATSIPPARDAVPTAHGTLPPSAEVVSQNPPAAAFETHRKATAALLARSREHEKRLYSDFFQAQGISGDAQDKIAAILATPARLLAEEALSAMRAGTMPTPPSPDVLQARRAEQDKALHTLLGDEGFAALGEYRATVPDRIIIDGMKRHGAELTAEQSQQLLGILTEERRRIRASDATRNLDALPASEVMAIIAQDQVRLRDAVNGRAESILNPEQAALLSDVFSGLTKVPKPR